jgi:probable phosphoglycerate mutase
VPYLNDELSVLPRKADDRGVPGRQAAGTGQPVPWELVTQPESPDAQPATFQQQRFAPPPGATEVVLVRHGQSQTYVDGVPFVLVNGQGDPPLTPLGQEQARLVCARLAARKVDAIYATGLQRTAQTAAPLAEATGLEILLEPGLREVFLGEWEGGLFRKMMAENGPVAQQVRSEERWDVIPGAESNEDMRARIRMALEKIAARHPGQRVAAFSHGGAIGQAVAIAADSRPFAFIGADNASITRLVITSERWIVRDYNDTAHLGA